MICYSLSVRSDAAGIPACPFRRDRAAIDAHHASPMMAKIAALREEYDLHMKVERFETDENGIPETDRRSIR